VRGCAPAPRPETQGEADIAIQQISELSAVNGIDIVGPLPAEIQQIVSISVGICRASVDRPVAHDLLKLLTSDYAKTNQRLVALDEHGVTFRWKDYRVDGRTRNKTMTLEADAFVRRFLLHVLFGGFHRIRHYGLLANPSRRENLAKIRELLGVVPASIGRRANDVATGQRSRPIRAPPAERAYA
jgi:hypothetical protein